MSTPAAIDPLAMLRPRRKPVGMSAILLPCDERREVDWPAFRAHVARTAAAGLTPAVNMDTGYVHLLDDATARRVLVETSAVLGGEPFIAGAFVKDRAGDQLNLAAYLAVIDLIQSSGGTPIVFQSHGLSACEPDALLAAYTAFARDCPRYLAFELGRMFAPFGRIYDLETYSALLDIPQCFGAKHSSLSRELEWRRLVIRDRRRPDFLVLTGNDLAIDMIMYGSDYLLGLSTMAPDLFARRDALWAAGDPRFYELNDLLQFLGAFAFRADTRLQAYRRAVAAPARMDCDERAVSGQPAPARKRFGNSPRVVEPDAADHRMKAP